MPIGIAACFPKGVYGIGRREVLYPGEDKYFRAGSGHLAVDIEGLAVSAFVCYDLRFADHFWALAKTTDLFIVPANWPASRAAHWTTLLNARAIENQAHVLGVNRVGTGGSLQTRLTPNTWA